MQFYSFFSKNHARGLENLRAFCGNKPRSNLSTGASGAGINYRNLGKTSEIFHIVLTVLPERGVF
jgi:hypothetical protein